MCNLSSYLFLSVPPMKTYAHYMFEWHILEPAKFDTSQYHHYRNHQSKIKKERNIFNN